VLCRIKSRIELRLKIDAELKREENSRRQRGKKEELKNRRQNKECRIQTARGRSEFPFLAGAGDFFFFLAIFR